MLVLAHVSCRGELQRANSQTKERTELELLNKNKTEKENELKRLYVNDSTSHIEFFHFHVCA